MRDRLLCLVFAACAPPDGSTGLDPDNRADPLSDLALRADALLPHLEALAEAAAAHGGHRAVGSPGYAASVRYVRDQLAALGLESWEQSVRFPTFDGGAGRLTAGALLLEAEPDLAVFTWSASGAARSTIWPVDLQLPPGEQPDSSTSGCEPSDFADLPPGAIALVQRGSCTFAEKVRNAEQAGASAVVLFNEGQRERRGVLSGVLGDRPETTLPVVGVSFEAGEILASWTGEVEVEVEVELGLIETVNVLADLPGETGASWVIGAHLDSVPAGPGINDNGTGVAALLQLAERFAALDPARRHGLRLAWWGAEEVGLRGSLAHTAQLAGQPVVLGNLNFDMIGSPNPARFVYDGDGSLGDALPGLLPDPDAAVIEALFVAHFDRLGLAHLPAPLEGRTDYVGFSQLGLPVGGLFTGAEQRKPEAEVGLFGGVAGEPYDPCYHASCDTVANVDLEVLEQLTVAAAVVIEALLPDTGAQARRAVAEPTAAGSALVLGACGGSEQASR